MANKKTEKEVVTTKDINKLVGDFLFSPPEKNEDGTIKTERYETGIVMLDLLLNGGFPKGKVLGLGAEEGIGKTTILIQSAGNIVEKYDKKVFYIDVEGGATFELFDAMGYSDLLYSPENNPTGKLYLISVETIQNIAKIVSKVAKDPETALIIIDSDTQVVDGRTLVDDELGMSNNAIGTDARMWSKSLKPINAVIKQSSACLIIVHQARMDLSGFIPRITSTAGRAARHVASAEIWGKKISWIHEGNSLPGGGEKYKADAIGAYVSLNTEKNRLTKPFASVQVPIFFGKGVSNLWAYKTWLEEEKYTDEATGEVIGFIEKNGSWYTINLPFISVKEKVQGDQKVWDIVMEHAEDIKAYIDTHGGFKTKKAESFIIT